MSAAMSWRSDAVEEDLVPSGTEYRPPYPMRGTGVYGRSGTSAETLEELSEDMIARSDDDVDALLSWLEAVHGPTMEYSTTTELSLGTAAYEAYEGVIAPVSILPRRRYGSWVIGGLGIAFAAVFLTSFVSETSPDMNIINPRLASFILLAIIGLMIETFLAILLRRAAE